MTKVYTDHSKHLRGKDIADREERKNARERGILLKPRYREQIGDTPVLEPGDCKGAGTYLEKVVRALQSGGWTRDERNRLKRIRRKWQRKADGKDGWFMGHGNPAGGEGEGQGNEYGRKGWKEQRAREEIKSAVERETKRIREKYGLSGESGKEGGGGEGNGAAEAEET